MNMKSFREYLENKDSSFILESRDKTVPVEFRTSFGVLQRLYNPKQVPDIKELEKDSKTVAKRYKLDADKFFEFAKKRFKEIYGNKIYEDVEDTESDEEAEDKIEEGASWKDAEDAAKDFFNILKKLGVKATQNSKNSIKLTHKNGCVGQLVFDPSINEAAVGQKGRTSYKEAMDYCDENEELVSEFRKIIKKLGGKTVAKALLDKLSQKPEIKDEIDNIEDIIDNSNY
jgi:hypothetical protein